MADAVGLWVIVYFCVTSVNTKACKKYIHTPYVILLGALSLSHSQIKSNVLFSIIKITQ